MSSLRPAFATIYPATRPDLAAELFFHTKPGSPLLKGIIEDDLITWFGKTDTGIPNVGQDLPDICECGKICRNYMKTTTTEKPTKLSKEITLQKNFQSEITNDRKNVTKGESFSENTKNVSNDIPIIVPSVTVGKIKTPLLEKTSVNPLSNSRGDEIVIQQNSDTALKPTKVIPLFDVNQRKSFPRKKGTLKYTYGENHEMMKTPSKPITNNSTSDITVTISSTLPTQTIGNILNYTNSNIQSNSIEESKNSLLNETHDSTTKSGKTYSETTPLPVHIQNETATTKQQSQDTTYETTTLPNEFTSTFQTMMSQTSQIPKSVNREKQHIPTKPISETTLNLISESSNVLPEKNDQYLVVDRNELWTLLKEVVHIEMDKNFEKSEVESSKKSMNDTLMHNRQV